MNNSILQWLAVSVSVVSSAVAWAQESVAPSIAVLEDRAGANAKGPYELSFADFGWQPSEVETRTIGSAIMGERMPTQQAIELFANRIARGPNDFANRTILGELFLRQAIDEDKLTAYGKATQVLKEARRINPKYKPAILGTAKVMMAQHQFVEALRVLGEIDATDASSPAELALTADCYLDMGNLVQAKIVLEKLTKLEQSPPVDARLARLAELMGDREKAIQLIRKALEVIKHGSSDENEWHWYQWRLAGLVFDSGDMELAEKLIRKLLDISPNDERSLILRARIAFVQDQFDLSRDLLVQVVDSHPSPPALALLGDLYRHRNEPTQAAVYWDKAETIIREEAIVAKVAHAREAALFFADHDRHLEEAMELILLDRQQRTDLITNDAHIWILHKNRRSTEAKQNLEILLTQNSSDLLSLYHAAKIYQSLDDIESAKRCLKKVVDVNPRFSILHAADIANLQSQWNLTPSRK